MKDRFQNYLIQQGYSTVTGSGSPSTVYDYAKRIDRICEEEGLSWSSLANTIDSIIPKYDTGGSKEEFGKQSHNAVINALKRYQEFCHYNKTIH